MSTKQKKRNNNDKINKAIQDLSNIKNDDDFRAILSNFEKNKILGKVYDKAPNEIRRKIREQANVIDDVNVYATIRARAISNQHKKAPLKQETLQALAEQGILSIVYDKCSKEAQAEIEKIAQKLNNKDINNALYAAKISKMQGDELKDMIAYLEQQNMLGEVFYIVYDNHPIESVQKIAVDNSNVTIYTCLVNIMHNTQVKLQSKIDAENDQTIKEKLLREMDFHKKNFEGIVQNGLRYETLGPAYSNFSTELQAKLDETAKQLDKKAFSSSYQQKSREEEQFEEQKRNGNANATLTIEAAKIEQNCTNLPEKLNNLAKEKLLIPIYNHSSKEFQQKMLTAAKESRNIDMLSTLEAQKYAQDICQAVTKDKQKIMQHAINNHCGEKLFKILPLEDQKEFLKCKPPKYYSTKDFHKALMNTLESTTHKQKILDQYTQGFFNKISSNIQHRSIVNMLKNSIKEDINNTNRDHMNKMQLHGPKNMFPTIEEVRKENKQSELFHSKMTGVPKKPRNKPITTQEVKKENQQVQHLSEIKEEAKKHKAPQQSLPHYNTQEQITQELPKDYSLLYGMRNHHKRPQNIEQSTNTQKSQRFSFSKEDAQKVAEAIQTHSQNIHNIPNFKPNIDKNNTPAIGA